MVAEHDNHVRVQQIDQLPAAAPVYIERESPAWIDQDVAVYHLESPMHTVRVRDHRSPDLMVIFHMLRLG